MLRKSSLVVCLLCILNSACTTQPNLKVHIINDAKLNANTKTLHLMITPTNEEEFDQKNYAAVYNDFLKNNFTQHEILYAAETRDFTVEIPEKNQDLAFYFLFKQPEAHLWKLRIEKPARKTLVVELGKSQIVQAFTVG